MPKIDTIQTNRSIKPNLGQNQDQDARVRKVGKDEEGNQGQNLRSLKEHILGLILLIKSESEMKLLWNLWVMPKWTLSRISKLEFTRLHSTKKLGFTTTHYYRKRETWNKS